MFLNSNLNLIDKYSERKQIKKSLYDKIKFGSIEFFDHIKKNQRKIRTMMMKMMKMIRKNRIKKRKIRKKKIKKVIHQNQKVIHLIQMKKKIIRKQKPNIHNKKNWKNPKKSI